MKVSGHFQPAPILSKLSVAKGLGIGRYQYQSSTGSQDSPTLN